MSTFTPKSLTLAEFLDGMRPDVAAECQYLFDEQAGRLEFDSGYSRADAERIALEMLPEIIDNLARGAA